jgi:hypothetical protein
MTLTPNTHERTEWQRLAQAAYSRGVSWLDHWASVEAATGRPMLIARFDALQAIYRRWLNSDELPTTDPRA